MQKSFQFICPMYGLRYSGERWHHQHNVSKRFVLFAMPMPCRYGPLAWRQPPFHLGVHFLFALATLLRRVWRVAVDTLECMLPSRSRLGACSTVLNAACLVYRGRKNLAFCFFLVETAGTCFPQCPHSARTVPAQCPQQCPHSARW